MSGEGASGARLLKLPDSSLSSYIASNSKRLLKSKGNRFSNHESTFCLIRQTASTSCHWQNWRKVKNSCFYLYFLNWLSLQNPRPIIKRVLNVRGNNLTHSQKHLANDLPTLPGSLSQSSFKFCIINYNQSRILLLQYMHLPILVLSNLPGMGRF